MFLKNIQIVNYKNLKNVCFEFKKGTNTVIGENDSGKTNAMTAMRILLDDEYFYNVKNLKETDFSKSLENWRGHWIIISAVFDEITSTDLNRELISQIARIKEDESFIKSSIRSTDTNCGTVTLFIRPKLDIRKKLFAANNNKDEFNSVRESISLLDYEFLFTARSNSNFNDPSLYNNLVGDIDNCSAANPNDDLSVIGAKVDIIDIWMHISLEYIDALRDVKTELRKTKNPLRRIFDLLYQKIDNKIIDTVKSNIRQLNNTISSIPEIKNKGDELNNKLNDIVGLIYSPEVSIESHIREELEYLARSLTLVPVGEPDIDQLGQGHLNILYIALKLVEFESCRKHEILNIVVLEEPEAHIHTHIQRTLFNNINLNGNYTQVIMTTHSTHISEVSEISRMNVLKRDNSSSIVMLPTKDLDKFSNSIFRSDLLPLDKCVERYLDAKRSVLMFSKAVILVEGDGEEILIPALVKKFLGVSLDEMGIGLINVGSVAFEYIACLFSPERLQRHCAIITDSDCRVNEAKKSSLNAENLGISRQEKLGKLFDNNPWVETFYAPHTLEIDFYEFKNNRCYLEQIIREVYSKEESIDKHINNLNNNEASRYDSVVTVLKKIGKGWHAVMLSELINKSNNRVEIPKYILNAISFASNGHISSKIKERIKEHIGLFTK